MKFLLTKELGRLAKWLRILGFDAEYFREDKKSSLIMKALQENRIIITRNRHLGEHPGIKKIQVKSGKINSQLKQVVSGMSSFELDKVLMFSRCTICNQLLIKIDKEKVKDKVAKYVFETSSEFRYCPSCQRIYWQGSHWGNVNDILEKIKK